jgi:hypothetical protein
MMRSEFSDIVHCGIDNKSKETTVFSLPAIVLLMPFLRAARDRNMVQRRL